MAEMKKFKCYDCGHELDLSYGIGRPSQCSSCDSKNIHRAMEDRDPHRHRRGRPFETNK